MTVETGRTVRRLPGGVRVGISLAVGGLIGIPVSIAGTAVFAHFFGQPTPTNPTAHSLTGAASYVVFFLVVGCIALVPIGIVVAGVAGLLSVRANGPRVDAERRQLALRRDSARTEAEVYAVQRAPIPGRAWRRFLPFAWVAPVLFAWPMANRAPQLALAALILDVPLMVAMFVTSRRRKASAAASLPTQPGAQSGASSDEAGLSSRADAVLAAASAAGLQFAGESPTPLAGARARPYNVCTGLVDGVAVTVFDDLDVVPSDTSVVTLAGVTHRYGTTMHDARTAARVDFPAVFRMVAAQRGRSGAEADVLWSSFGSEISLESGDFASRFVVYCDDPIRVRMVLNPAVMDLLLRAPVPLELFVLQGVLEVATSHELLPAPHLLSLARFVTTVASSARSTMADLGTSPAV